MGLLGIVVKGRMVMRKRGLVILYMGLCLSMTACGKKEEVVETSEVVESTEETTVASTLETDVDEIKETVVGIGEIDPEDTLKIDDIIAELANDVARESVSLGDLDDDSVNESKRAVRDADTAFEDSLRESLGIEPTEESSLGEIEDAVGSADTEVYDIDDDPNTREVEAFEEETEPIIGEDGAYEDTVDFRIQKAIEKTDHQSGEILENNSEVMKVGSIYHYLVDDGSEYGMAGDYVMCGKLAIDVPPMFSASGYQIKTYDNTVEFITSMGTAKVTKLNTDALEVEKMSAQQMDKLSGVSTTFTFMNATKGSFGAYSMLRVDDEMYGTKAVQYYTCRYGTYQFVYETDFKGMIYNLAATITPEASLNEGVPE